MAAAGYDVAQGDTWALNELTTSVRRGDGNARANVREEAAEPPASPDEALTARITLRLPDALKQRVEEATAREGLSVNTWIVQALGRISSGAPRRSSGRRLSGYGRS